MFFGNFGATFKRLREERGFSLKEAAGDAVTPQFLSKWEKGQSNISLTNLSSVLENIGIDWNTYFYKEHHFFPSNFIKRQLEINDYISKREYLEAIQELNKPWDKEEVSEYQLVTYKAVVKQGLANRYGDSVLGPDDRKEIEYVVNRMSRIESWANIEFNVYVELINYFTYEFIQQRAKETIQELKSDPYVHHMQLGQSMLHGLRSTVRYYSEHEYYIEAEKLSQELLNLLQSIPHLGNSLWFFFDISFERACNFLRQNKEEGLEIAADLIKGLDNLKKLSSLQVLTTRREQYFQIISRLNKTGKPFNP